MTARTRLVMSSLLAVFLLFPLEVAFAATLTVDDDGEDCPGASFTTISSALLGAAPGDTIEVCTGTYTEQVTISESLTVKAATGQAPVVEAPGVMDTPRAVIRVTGLGVSVTLEALTISGGGVCPQYGIRVDGGAQAVIRNNTFGAGGCQSSVAILVGRQFEATAGTAVIQGNIIQGYERAGVVVDNAGSSATITENVITGAGPTSELAQNGVQMSRGASGEVRANSISGHVYTGCNSQVSARTGCIPFVASGLLLFDIRPNAVQHSANTFRGNQSNVQTVTDLRLAPGP